MRGNTKQSSGFVTDTDGEVRTATGWNLSDNSVDTFARKKGSKKWELVRKYSGESRETFDFLGFSKNDPNEVYVKANLGEDKVGIYTYNLETKAYSERLFGLKNVDADGILRKPYSSEVTGYHYTSKHPTKHFINPNEQALHDSIQNIFQGKHVSVLSRSKGDDSIVVKTSSDSDTGTYYLINDKKSVKLIGEKLPLVDKNKLGNLKYITYTARDGRKIKAYVTIPTVGKKPYPAVVLPHGGPWVRDVNIFDDWSQLLASHGYIVIQPQYRGSTVMV